MLYKIQYDSIHLYVQQPQNYCRKEKDRKSKAIELICILLNEIHTKTILLTMDRTSPFTRDFSPAFD